MQTIAQLTSSRTIGPISSRSKIGRDDIKWQELLLHFRSVQARHEKARRQALGADTSTISGFPDLDKLGELIGERPGRAPTAGRPPMRRRVTGGELPNAISPAPPVASKSGALSPLNPKARVPSGLTGIIPSQSGASVTSSNTNAAAALTQAQRQRRPIDLTRRA